MTPRPPHPISPGEFPARKPRTHGSVSKTGQTATTTQYMKYTNNDIEEIGNVGDSHPSDSKKPDRGASNFPETENSRAAATTPESDAEVTAQIYNADERLVRASKDCKSRIPDGAELVAVNTLKINPASDKIYGTEIPESLVSSIEEEGIQSPLIVCKNSRRIISGNTRLRIAQKLLISEVPVIFLSGEISELEECNLILHHNVAREKSREMLVREYLEFQRVEIELGKERRKVRGKDKGLGKVPNLEPKSRNKAAERVGQSATSLDTGAKVLEVIENLSKHGRHNEGNRLREVLNEKGFSPALNLARAKKWTEDLPDEAKKRRASNPPVNGSPVRISQSDTPPLEPDSSGVQRASDLDPNADSVDVREWQKELEHASAAGEQVERFLRGDVPSRMTSEERERFGDLLGRINVAAALADINPCVKNVGKPIVFQK